ncbi:kinase domain-containing protein [Encephalitozoon hellem]|uniref:Kinase domain-containing protein n=1 Tax=Encephalitozoon hellem TaxID=27973 RepID=A0ABY8CKY8_ENCHE|nr:kinase domain-containing protein [Encephalitozoon hellem]
MNKMKKNDWKHTGFGALSVIQGYHRRMSRKIQNIFFMALALLSFIFLYKKYFFVCRAKEDQRMERMCLDFINKRVDKCLQHKSRYEQNKEFAAIKTHLPLIPLKMTRSNAVFLYTYRKPYVVIKRCIAPGTPGLAEDEILMSLDHKNVVKFLKSFREKYMNLREEEETIIWIFMEHMDSKVSQDVVKGNENKIREIAKGILHGLKYLHGMGIAHLDLKISNVMGKETKDGIVYKIIDFGFARKLEHVNDNAEIQIPSKSFGTYPYKPPETSQLNMHGVKGDIWCLGAIVWFLSRRQTPFYFDDGRKNLEEWRMFIRGRLPISFKPNASPALRDFVKKCMNFDRFARPNASDLLEHPFITGVPMKVTSEDLNEMSEEFSSTSEYSSMESED